MRLPDTSFPTFPMVPPEFDPELWDDSFQAIIDTAPHVAWMTHFDGVPEPTRYLERARRRLLEETRLAVALLEHEEEEAVVEYRGWLEHRAISGGIDPELLHRYCDRTYYTANLSGVRRWREKGGTLP